MKQTNWPLLSGMRFCLAFIVVCAHLVNVVPHDKIFLPISQLSATTAVMVFFAISGYSISHSIQRKPQGYMVRRIYRIYPAYLACLVAAVAVYALFGFFPTWADGTLAEAPTPLQLIGNAIMMQQFLVHPINSMRPNWSLAIEELFYLCAPLLVMVNRRYIWAAIAASVVFGTTLPHFHSGYYSEMVGLWGAGALAWAWLLGWVLHRAAEAERTRTLVFGAFCIAVMFNPWGSKNGVVLAAVAMWLLIHNRDFALPARVARVCTWLGDISYPLYISHFCVLLGLWTATHSTVSWHYVAASLAFAVAVHHGIERPFRAYRRWAEPKPGHANQKAIPA